MNKYLKEINELTLRILEPLPNYKKNIYLLEEYDFEKENILVMYNTGAQERKSLYINHIGVYINGRENRDDPSPDYLRDFDNFEFNEKDSKKIQEVIDSKKEKLDTRISSRDIKIGYLCREFKKKKKRVESYYIYLGKANMIPTESYHKRKEKQNIYMSVSWRELENFKNKNFSKCHVEHKNSKIRFDKIICKYEDKEIIELRKLVKKSGYPFDGYEIEWLKTI